VRVKYGSMKKYQSFLTDSENEAQKYISEIKKLRPDIQYQIIPTPSAPPPPVASIKSK